LHLDHSDPEAQSHGHRSPDTGSETKQVKYRKRRFLVFHTISAGLDIQQNDMSPQEQGEKEKYIWPEWQTSTGYFNLPFISCSIHLVISCL
jgi:hypothetical protein